MKESFAALTDLEMVVTHTDHLRATRRLEVRERREAHLREHDTICQSVL